MHVFIDRPHDDALRVMIGELCEISQSFLGDCVVEKLPNCNHIVDRVSQRPIAQQFDADGVRRWILSVRPLSDLACCNDEPSQSGA
jgi:hypothetical protein